LVADQRQHGRNQHHGGQSSVRGIVTVFPRGLPAPTTSNLNYLAGQEVPNLLEPSTGNAVDISIHSSAGTDVLVDVF
jgi:hypothetical protein